MNARQSLAQVNDDIAKSTNTLNALRKARADAIAPIARQTGAHPMLSTLGLTPESYDLVAQGDSWFDYLPGHDIIDYLRGKHGHKIENLAVGGSTLNEIVYGPVPENFFGVPQSGEVDRSTELVATIQRVRPQGLLLSGGGNDIAGPEFFQFINNALSGLGNPNARVLDGVLNETLEKAYQDMIGLCLRAGDDLYSGLKIFIHGYDYPWPDGRGVTIFNLVGPWFDETFNQKHYPYKTEEDLLTRFNIVKICIDLFNGMLGDLEKIFPARVFHVDLRGLLHSRDEWANELHPKNLGFEKLADKINLILHQHLP